MRLLNIKHYVELAHIFEVLVQCLYQIVNEFEEGQLVLNDQKWVIYGNYLVGTYHIFIVVHANNKVKRGIATINYFILTVLEETTLVLRPTKTFTNQLALQSDSFAHAKTIEVFGEARLALLIHH